MDNHELKLENDQLRSLLVDACKILFGSSGNDGKMSGFAMPDKHELAALVTWWMKHVRTHRPNTAARDKALAKLTKEERTILGL